MLLESLVDELLDEMAVSAIGDVEHGHIADFDTPENALDAIDRQEHGRALYGVQHLRDWIDERLEGVLNDAYIKGLKQDVYDRTEQMIVELLERKA
jgi:hypothetical protein